MVGELLAGAILGPQLLGLVRSSEVMDALAELGVIMLLFMAGLETHIEELMETRAAAIKVAVLGAVLPFVAGALVGLLFGWERALFMATALTATSVGITVRALRELGHSERRSVRIILAAAVLDDVLGLIVLVVVAGTTLGSFDVFNLVLLIVEAIAYVGLFGFFGPRLVVRLRDWLKDLKVAVLFEIGVAQRGDRARAARRAPPMRSVSRSSAPSAGSSDSGASPRGARLLLLDGRVPGARCSTRVSAGLLEPVELLVRRHEPSSSGASPLRSSALLGVAESQRRASARHRQPLQHERQQHDAEGEHLQGRAPLTVGRHAEHQRQGDGAAQPAPDEHVLPASGSRRPASRETSRSRRRSRRAPTSTTAKPMRTSPRLSMIVPRSMRRPMSRKISELATKAAYSQTVLMVTRVTGPMVRCRP